MKLSNHGKVMLVILSCIFLCLSVVYYLSLFTQSTTITLLQIFITTPFITLLGVNSYVILIQTLDEAEEADNAMKLKKLIKLMQEVY